MRLLAGGATAAGKAPPASLSTDLAANESAAASFLKASCGLPAAGGAAAVVTVNCFCAAIFSARSRFVVTPLESVPRERLADATTGAAGCGAAGTASWFSSGTFLSALAIAGLVTGGGVDSSAGGAAFAEGISGPEILFIDNWAGGGAARSCNKTQPPMA